VSASSRGAWPGVRAVLFDFGGTLDAEGVPWKERFFRLWREESGGIARARFEPAFYAADDALVGAVPADLPLAQTASRLARGIAQRLGADSPAAERVAGRFLEETRACLAESAAVLARLAGSFRLGVVSNFYGNLGAVCEESGLAPHLSAAIDSACVGFTKPDPKIFRAALAAIGAEPAATLFVGDSLERDMVGARSLGMPHVRLSPVSAPEDGCCAGDRVIRRVAELEGLLA
jgi:HAD superfamily hydrolase (TIGR01549 family)